MDIFNISQNIEATAVRHGIFRVTVDIHPIIFYHLRELCLHFSQLSLFVGEQLERRFANGGFCDMLAHSVLKRTVLQLHYRSKIKLCEDGRRC